MRDIEKNSAGFTLIEMLVGIVIGMIVVAAASVMMVSVLKSQKDITASARLNQELGAAMAVMSNEIRRAGFRVCDMKKMHDATPYLACPDNDDGEEVPYITYALGDDLKVGDVDGVGNDDGDCILYRYNADVDRYGHDAADTDTDVDYLSEHRGFRLVVTDGIGVIQIADNDDATDVACNANTRWITLTNPDVINITALSFSTTGSKCRNMSGNFYWVVGDGATGLACDDGTNLDSAADCIDLNDPADPRVPLVAAAGCGTATTVMSEWITGEFVDPPDEDALFGVNQIRINLKATLTRDSAVSKILRTSVKIANPWIR